MAKVKPLTADELKKKLRTDFDDVTVSADGSVYLSLWRKTEDFRAKVLEQKGEFINDEELFDIITNSITKIIGFSNTLNRNCKLSELAKPEQLDAACAEVQGLISSLPRTYLLCVELPNLHNQDASNFNLTKKVRAVDCIAPTDGHEPMSSWKTLSEVLGMASQKSEEAIPGGFYFLIETKGYGLKFDSQAVIDGLNTLKQALALLEDSGSIHYRYFPLNTKPPKVVLNESGAKPVSIEVPSGLASLLNRVCIKDERKLALESYTARKKAGQLTFGLLGEEHEPDPVLHLSAKAQFVIDAELDNQNTISMKNALTWYMDSIINSHDKAMSFLQLSIALEASIGHDSGKNAKTATLADRCAMLVGKTNLDRKEIRENFIKFYNCRSDIVHGGLTKLDAKVSENRRWADTMLQMIFRRELAFNTFGVPRS